MSLTEAAYYTRRAINWLILGIILYIIGKILLAIIIAIILWLFPPHGPPPNHRFGKLPAIVFPTAEKKDKLTFKLETIEGSVPKASDSAVVYFMPKSPPNMLALPRTQTFAERLQFLPNPIQQTKNIYRFDDADLQLRTLTYNIISNNFVLRYAYEQDTGLFLDNNIPTPEAAETDAHKLIQQLNILPDDYNGGGISTTFLKLTGNELVPVLNQSLANALRVDFFRLPILGIKVFNPDPDHGPISITYTGSVVAKKKMIDFTYTYWPIDYRILANYQVKTSDVAWTELQNGKGYIARYPSQGTTATVRKVYLGYYDTYDAQNYLQPIFVFEGDYGFLGYVPAVAPPWTE
jgi:hypothetical protein